MEDVIRKLSMGNVGALTALIKLWKELERDNPLGFAHLLKLHHMAIYGPRIWMLYEDVFGSKIAPFYYALKHNRLEKVIQRVRDLRPDFADQWDYYIKEEMK